jgi:hypothetical protein
MAEDAACTEVASNDQVSHQRALELVRSEEGLQGDALDWAR